VRVVHLSFHVDPARRPAAELLEAWPALTLLPAAAASAGVEVAVAQAHWRDDAGERLGVPVRFVAERREGRLARNWPSRLVRAALALRPDVMHVHGLRFPLPLLRLALSARVPLLVQDHSGRRPLRGWRRTAQRLALSRVAAAAFSALEDAEPFRAAGVLPARVPLLVLGEAWSGFTPGDPAAARARSGIGGDPCLLWIGKLDANKDPLTALEALSRALPALPDARLWMCFHDAPLLAEVRARLAAEPALAERVALLGRVPHAAVEDLCRAADFLVVASRREGRMFALMEAMACGAAPLAADLPSLRAMTGGGAVGAHFPPGDADALARLLVEWAPRREPGLRAAVRAHHDRHLSREALGRELRAAYESLAGAR
jgi:glycosyltransferase involved in cell wall biosynthesis